MGRESITLEMEFELLLEELSGSKQVEERQEEFLHWQKYIGQVFSTLTLLTFGAGKF